MTSSVPNPPRVPPWTPPWPTRDVATFTRVSAGALKGDSRWDCPEMLAMKARPQVRPRRDPAERPVFPPYEAMPLGLIRTAAYAVLRHGIDEPTAIAGAIAEARREVVDPLPRIVAAGVEGYLATVADRDAVVRDFIAVDDSPSDEGGRVEWYGWGICRISRDSQVREYDLLTYYAAGERPRRDAVLGVYARIAADAIAVQENSPWWDAFAPAQAQPRPGSRVRLREVGVLDSSVATLWEGTVEEARDLFDRAVPATLPVLGGGPTEPGPYCADCAARPECSGLPRRPGLLGVAGPSTWPRRLAPGDLGGVCRWQSHLRRDLGVPAEPAEPTDAMRRGNEIHRWLEHAHGRREACREEDLPAIAGDLGWSDDEIRAWLPYLEQHLAVCPLRRHDPQGATPEQSLTAWDTDADIVASTRADLVIRDGDRTIVRETKTLSAVDPDVDWLRRYPQVALALLMLEGAPGSVELELLTPTTHEVVSFDPEDPETVLRARTLVADATDRYLYDPVEPTPGPWCSWCPVARWCDARDEERPAAEPSLLLLSQDVTPDDDIPF